LNIDQLFETQPYHYNYIVMADRVIKGCARAIALYCDYLDSTEIEQIGVKPNEICGLDEMIPYEVKWCAWPNYKVVSMPDIHQLPEDHCNFMRKKMGTTELKSKGKFFLDFYMSTLRAPCHEVIHIIQHLARQTGNTCQAEHDASYAMMTLMWAIVEQEELSDIFEKGIKETVIHATVESAIRVWDSWTDFKKNEYHRWINAFGLYKIEEWQNDLEFESDCKTMICAEAMIGNGEVNYPKVEYTKDMLDLLFKNRSGNILNTPVVPPSHLKVELNRIDKLRAPCHEDKWKLILELIKQSMYSSIFMEIFQTFYMTIL